MQEYGKRVGTNSKKNARRVRRAENIIGGDYKSMTAADRET
jgi:hypothetical protein